MNLSVSAGLRAVGSGLSGLAAFSSCLLVGFVSLLLLGLKDFAFDPFVPPLVSCLLVG